MRIVRIGLQMQRAGIWLTLAATLVVGVLPFGSMPRIAGPCGKSLCDCRLDSIQTGSEQQPSAQVLTFKTTSVSDVDAPGIVLYSVIGAVDFQAALNLPITTLDLTGSALSRAALIALTAPSADIPTPPPRA